MKSLMTIGVLVLSSVGFAAATCPTGTDTGKSCVSTPKAGDQEFASALFTSIAVCQEGEKTLMVLKLLTINQSRWKQKLNCELVDRLIL